MSNKQFRHVPAEEHLWLREMDIARELGLGFTETRQLLRRVHKLIPEQSLRRRKGVVVYPAGVLEVARGLLGQPHRSIEPPERDWLSRYLQISD